MSTYIHFFDKYFRTEGVLRYRSCYFLPIYNYVSINLDVPTVSVAACFIQLLNKLSCMCCSVCQLNQPEVSCVLVATLPILAQLFSF